MIAYFCGTIVRLFTEGRVQVSIGAFWDLFHVLMNRASKKRVLHQVYLSILTALFDRL